MGIDWNAIKSEYITNTDTSYRKLAQTYGVDQATIARRAKKEDWVSKRQQNVSTVQAKIVDAISDQQVDRATKLLSVADLLLDKVRQRIEAVDPMDMGSQEFRHLSATIKDLKEIQIIQPDSSKNVVVEMSEEVDALSG